MDEIKAWVLSLCACAAVISIAEQLLPEGSVKKTAYLMLSLITALSLCRPIKNLRELDFDFSLNDSDTAPYTDWLGRETSREFAKRAAGLIEDVLCDIGVSAEKISVETDINSGGSVYISKARITAQKRYADMIEEIESAVYSRLGIEADVTIDRG